MRDYFSTPYEALPKLFNSQNDCFCAAKSREKRVTDDCEYFRSLPSGRAPGRPLTTYALTMSPWDLIVGTMMINGLDEEQEKKRPHAYLSRGSDLALGEVDGSMVYGLPQAGPGHWYL